MAVSQLKKPEVSADGVECFVGFDGHSCRKSGWDRARFGPAFEMYSSSHALETSASCPAGQAIVILVC